MVKKDFSEQTQTQKLTFYDHLIQGPLVVRAILAVGLCMMFAIFFLMFTLGTIAICKTLIFLHYWHIDEPITKRNSFALHFSSLFLNISIFVVCTIFIRLINGDLTMALKRAWKAWKSGEFWNLMLVFIPYFGNYFFKSYCKVCTTKGTWNEDQICEHCKYK